MKKNGKPSKLREKQARFSSIQIERKAETVREYVARLRQRPELSEYARGVAFIDLLKGLLFDAEPQFLGDYLEGMERSLAGPRTALYNRGRTDGLYGNLIIEFKRDLSKTLDDAQAKLQKYFSILFSRPEERHRPLIGIATDGIAFIAYAPRFDLNRSEFQPEDIQLVEMEKADLAAIDPKEVYYWLDRYFVRQTGPLAPTTKQIVQDFGPSSGAFIHAMNVLESVWKAVESDTESQVFFDNWQKYLRITYGGPVADRELFLRHTYLATLAKVMVWVRLTGAKEPPKDAELHSVLNGQYFNQRGIHNFLEEDFFAWVARDAAWPQALIVARRLVVQHGTYNLRELSEDVLKGLYERLVDPKDRHDLGEYYTPDWLAAKIVDQCLEANPEASMLDPACGSGTFLYQTIRFKKDRLGMSAKTLKHIEQNVVGMDIHPLAVIVAKTTYLLGLGDLVVERKAAFRIPVYLSDSVRPPEEKLRKRQVEAQGDLEFPSPLYLVPLDGATAEFPEDFALTGGLYDRAIELCAQYAASTADDKLPSDTELTNFLRRNEVALARDPVWLGSLYELFKVLRAKIRERKDTIWAFILKNVFKPLLMKGRFDVLVGNPPWLTYKDIEKGEYQDFLKTEITKHYQLLTGRPELLTHMELGTLFFVRSADMYLKEGGRIGFVLPKSIFVADQHHAFRHGNPVAHVRLMEAWDLEGVRPLFNVPAAVAFAEKAAEGAQWPLAGKVLAGELSGKNAPLAEADQGLTERETSYWLSIKGTRSYFSEKEEAPVTEGSPYGEKFSEGAAMFPRSFWFVELQNASGLGVDSLRPFVKTDPRAIEAAKENYKDVYLEGNVEAEFLYQTMLSTDLVPFGHLPFRTVVLPIVGKGDHYVMLNAQQARKEGYLGLAEWLEKCEAVWKRKRGDKAERESIYDWLDYRKKLTQQRRKRYTVVYPASATYLCSAVVTNASEENKPERFLDESMLYFHDTELAAEAHYLAAILTSGALDQALKPLQARGDFGPRHIHKKMWAFPIPLYNDQSASHERLARLGQECSTIAQNYLDSLPANIREGSLGRLRNMVREKLRPQLDEIDELVRKILKLD